ncbi:MAG: T9SS type A sorting domain-containing protein [Bacteroidota bacterium]
MAVFQKVIILGLLFFIASKNLTAQNPTLSIGNVGICNTPTVLVPLAGANLTNIGSITLFISFDDLSLTFDTVLNVDPQLNGLLFNRLSNPSRIALVWSNVNGAHFQNTNLLNLKFNVLQQSSALTFISGCEIANLSLQIVPVNFVNGSVYPAMPIISAGPDNKTVKSQANAIFQVTSPDATIYTWQESRNSGTSWNDLTDGTTYSGIHTAEVTIKHVPTNFNHFVYRCVLKKDNCPSISNQATLSVDSVSGMYEDQQIKHFAVYNKPNPFSETTTIVYNVPDEGIVSIELRNMMGKCMVKLFEGFRIKGEYMIEKNFLSLPIGIYFCRYRFTSSAQTSEIQCKMIKINKN